MSFVGNLNGPKKSVIVEDLGHKYFGITPKELEEEIEYYINQEMNNVIESVYKDKEERYFLIFEAPDGKRQKYYLQDYGYNLHGKLKVIQEKE